MQVFPFSIYAISRVPKGTNIGNLASFVFATDFVPGPPPSQAGLSFTTGPAVIPLRTHCFSSALHLSHLSLVPPSRCTSFDCLHAGDAPNCCLKMHVDADSGRLQVVLHSIKDFGPEECADGTTEADALQERESIVKSIDQGAEDEDTDGEDPVPWEIKLSDTGVALVPVRN